MSSIAVCTSSAELQRFARLNEAEPFVISHAKSESSLLVTEENCKGPNTPERSLKIPNVADEQGVEVLKFFEYVRREGWTF